MNEPKPVKLAVKRPSGEVWAIYVNPERWSQDEDGVVVVVNGVTYCHPGKTAEVLP